MENQKNELLVGIWESNSDDFSFIEEAAAASEVDGVHILAKVEGPAFFPDTISGNKVFYPPEAWENALSNPKLVADLRDRLVYGTIGHNSDLTDDDIRDGKASHIVTRIWLDENNIGMAEYLILGTNAGKTLNTLLRAKSKLRVSTRASGLFKSNLGKDGSKTVDSKTFTLDRIDFVRSPGYNDALPNLVESLNNDVKQGTNMNQETTNPSRIEQIFESRIDELSKDAVLNKDVIRSLNEDLNQIRIEQATNTVTLNSYQALGTVTSLHESLALLQQYAALGSVQDIHEALEQGEDTINSLTGTVSNLTSELEDAGKNSAADYDELGSPEEVKSALDSVLVLADELNAYRELGSVAELKEVLDQATSMTETLENEQKDKVCSGLGIDRETFDSMMSKGYTIEEATDLINKLKPSTAVETTVPPVNEEDDPDKEKAQDDPTLVKNPDEEENKDNISESLSSRLLARNRKLRATSINESTEQKTPAVVSPKGLAARLISNNKRA